MSELIDNPLALTLFVFLARVTDVSLSTVRTVLLFRGRRLTAAIIGFFEVLVWLSAAGTVLNNLDTWYLAVAFAAGFGTGNYVGLWLEAKLAIGHQLVRVISESRQVQLSDRLREQGHEVLEVPARDAGGKSIELLFIVSRRRLLPKLLHTVESLDPDAVTTISDVTPHERLPAPPTRTRVPRWAGVVKKK